MTEPSQLNTGNLLNMPLDEAALLRVRSLTAGYGKIRILHGVDMDVEQGEIVCVIGPNGAGKSTVFKCVYGFIKPESGTVFFGDANITGLPPEAILRHGVTFVPQGRTTFAQMTVEENLALGMY